MLNLRLQTQQPRIAAEGHHLNQRAHCCHHLRRCAPTVSLAQSVSTQPCDTHTPCSAHAKRRQREITPGLTIFRLAAPQSKPTALPDKIVELPAKIINRRLVVDPRAIGVDDRERLVGLSRNHLRKGLQQAHAVCASVTLRAMDRERGSQASWRLVQHGVCFPERSRHYIVHAGMHVAGG